MSLLSPEIPYRRAARFHMNGQWIVSVDLGQVNDPTAVAVLETTTRRNVVDRYYGATESERVTMAEPPREWYTPEGTIGFESRIVSIDVRHLERLPLGMDYLDIVAHIGHLMRRPPFDRITPRLVCDATGVGKPVLNLFERGGLRPIGVTITAGDGETEVAADRDYRVSKLMLVSRLQAALHSGELRIAPKLKEAENLVSELQDFRASITDTGYTRFNAREGKHDDLVLAVAIGCWLANRPKNTTAVFSFCI